MTAKQPAPIIGITPDLEAGKLSLNRAYADKVVRAGGVPLVLAPIVELIPRYLQVCAGFILSGGDDPDMRQWNQPMHPKAKAIDPERQRFECALLAALDRAPDRSILGICLGMQLMGLHAGGALDQYLPDNLESAADHWDRKEHRIEGELGSGIVKSHHRQALTDPGSLCIVARAHDRVIEAVQDPDRQFYLGVQWHPERTNDVSLGSALIERLIDAAGQCATNSTRRLKSECGSTG